MKKIAYTIILIVAVFSLCVDMLAVQFIGVAAMIFSLHKLKAFSNKHGY